MNTSEYFSDIATAFAEQYNTDPAFQERFHIWSGLLDKYGARSSSAIDLGCGAGIFSLYLAKKGIDVFSVDNSEAMLELAGQRARKAQIPNVSFKRADLGRLTAPELPPADLVISSSVLEYIDDIERILQLCADVLKPHGHLIVSLPNAESFYRRFEPWQYKLIKRPHYYKHVKFVCAARNFEERAKLHGLAIRELHYYSHQHIISRVAAGLRLPKRLTGNLFVSVFQKGS